MAFSHAASKAPRPPRDIDDLLARAEALAGMTVAALEQAHGVAPSASPGRAVHTKGKVGALVERALGATGGSAAVHDFPELGVELKTIPLAQSGKPQESTFVCTLSLTDAEYAEWDTSWAKRKLSRVLFVPVLAAGDDGTPRTFGRPVLWTPTHAQEDALRRDFDDLVGLIAIGGIERVTAHMGRFLQVRPKAATGRVRTLAFGHEGEPVATVPRGFYLRARFTGAVVACPDVHPDAIDSPNCVAEPPPSER